MPAFAAVADECCQGFLDGRDESYRPTLAATVHECSSWNLFLDGQGGRHKKMGGRDWTEIVAVFGDSH